MKNYIFIILILFSIQVEAQSWKLLWSDEFNYSGLPDSTKWSHEVGNNKNNELQCYTSRRPENSIVKNGNLHIIALKEDFQKAKYTSARLSTDGKFSFKYGKIEARIKTTTGKGIWPAFWLLGQNIAEVGSPKCGEIDIMEHVNTEDKIHSAMHWDNNGLVSHSGTKTCKVLQFHTYAVEWNKNSVKWFLDGKKYFEGEIKADKHNTAEFQQPFYIILNMAVGGTWPGKPDNTTTFPDTLYVDYVRVYQKPQSKLLNLKF
ncbi:MAG: glycoside hydrolase family 16 protein [Paludibacter sp.]